MPQPLDEAQAQAQVQALLGHTFSDVRHLKDALTHSSFRNEKPHLARSDNERLEFLGDTILATSVSELLYRAFPSAPEGELTRRRSALVRESALAELALELEIPAAMRLGRGEALSGGREKSRLLASALEALIGAVWEDAGRDAAFAVVRRLWDPMLEGTDARTDYKSMYQEHVQALRGSTPRYQVAAIEGPDHDRRFVIELLVDEQVITSARGRSKSEAEYRAAAKAMQQIFDAEETSEPEG